MARIIWSRTDVVALGVRTDVATAGSIFGLSRTQAYEALNRGDFPVPTFRIGRRVIVPVAPILSILGLDTEPGTNAREEALAVA